MTSYSFYFMDQLGRVFGRNDYSAPDDLGALEAAQELHPGFAMEIWDGDRIVARITQDGRAALGGEPVARPRRHEPSIGDNVSA